MKKNRHKNKERRGGSSTTTIKRLSRELATERRRNRELEAYIKRTLLCDRLTGLHDWERWRESKCPLLSIHRGGQNPNALKFAVLFIDSPYAPTPNLLP